MQGYLLSSWSKRAPGHTVGDNKIYNKGFLEFKEEIEEEIKTRLRK